MARQPRQAPENREAVTIIVGEANDIRVADVARLLGVTPQTVRNWIDRGLPVVQNGGQGRGVVTTLSMSDVVAHLVDSALRDVGAAHADEGGQVYNESAAKAKDMHYRALLRQAQALEKLKLLIPVDVIEDAVNHEYSLLRTTLLGIASAIDVTLAAESDPRACFDIVEGAIARALSFLSSGRAVVENVGLDPDGSITQVDAIEALNEAAIGVERDADFRDDEDAGEMVAE